MNQVSKGFLSRFQKIVDRLDDLRSNNDDPDYVQAERKQIETLAQKLLKEPDAPKFLESLSAEYDTLNLTADGDIVFGDKYKHHHITVRFDDSSASNEASIRKYHENLRKRLNQVRLLEAVERKAGSLQSASLELEDIFVSLKTHATDEGRMRKQDWRVEKIDKDPILLSEAVAKHRVAAVLGKPGSGKTTFVNRLLISVLDKKPLPGWSENEIDLTPLHLNLRQFADWLEKERQQQRNPKICAGLLWCYVSIRLHDNTEETVLNWLKHQADQTKLLIVLDGLDEVPYDLTGEIKSTVEDFIRHNQGNRCLVTCRTLSWGDEIRGDKPWQLDGEWPLLPIHDLDDGQIKEFVDIWYRILAHRWGITESEKDQLIQGFTQALERPSLREIRQVPLLLTVMALVHTERQNLPDELAALYKRAVELLVDRWDTIASDDETHRLSKLEREAGCSREDLVGVLAELAWRVHGGDLKSTSPSDIALQQLQEALAAIGPKKQGDYVQWQDDVIRGMRLRAGLLLPVGGRQDLFHFPHRSFQEYLAGLHLASLPDSLAEEAAGDRQGIDNGGNTGSFTATLKRIAGESNQWRYVIQFAAGILGSEPTGFHKALHLLRALVPTNPENGADWRRLWMAGIGLREIGPRRVANKDAALKNSIHQGLISLIESGVLTWRNRVDVAGLLNHASLGDRRSGIVEPAWVKVCGRPFILGSDEGDEEAYGDEYQKPRRITMPHDYLVSRYPVTVRQYQVFLNDGSDQKHPDSWDEQLMHGNRPVVNVDWRDAVAYCEWGSEQLSSWGTKSGALTEFTVQGPCVVRLPSEAEWEFAARSSDGRSYPWGDADWEPEKALLNNQEIKHAAPVGLFPEGAAQGQSAGICDMSGNVWEWTLSKWVDYPYADKNGVVNPARNEVDESDDSRVVRGGAFDLRPRLGRCAVRSNGHPRYGNRNVGFRVIVSLANTVF